MNYSSQALALLAQLLEQAEEQLSICSDLFPPERKDAIEELWELYAELQPMPAR
jgi:hypothetical protein